MISKRLPPTPIYFIIKSSTYPTPFFPVPVWSAPHPLNIGNTPHQGTQNSFFFPSFAHFFLLLTLEFPLALGITMTYTAPKLV